MPQLDQTALESESTGTLHAPGGAFLDAIPADTVKKNLKPPSFEQAKPEVHEALQITVELPPFPGCIEKTSDGAIRVAGHRVSLYLILDAIFLGAPIHEIRSMYPTIAAQQLWDVIVFCNQHLETMRRYHRLMKTQEEAQIQSHRSTIPPLEELRARRARRLNQE